LVREKEGVTLDAAAAAILAAREIRAMVFGAASETFAAFLLRDGLGVGLDA
jgi:hypothetical protein